MGKYTASDGTEFDTKREWRKYEFELSFTFKNKKNEQLSKEAGKIDGQPFDIAECEGCEIVITDHCDQVQIDQLKTCRVFLGASSESVFVRDCSDCTFYLACKQLRTRDCHNCTFYLYAKTEPIIELSDGICFAPFLGGYPEQAQHMKSANLDPSYNLWWGVFDFNDEFKTLNHWKYLDEGERKPWFPRGGMDQICACPPPGDAAALPSQTGGNFGSSGGMMSFGFNTSLEQAEQAHLEMEATTAPPPLPPGAPATAVAPPVAVPAAPAPAAAPKAQSFKALDRVDARFQGDVTWYPGTIATALPGDKYDIAYVRARVEINLQAIIAGGLKLDFHTGRRRPRVRRPRGADPQGDRRARRHHRPRRRRGGGGARTGGGRAGARGEEAVEPAGRGAEPSCAAAAAVRLGKPFTDH